MEIKVMGFRKAIKYVPTVPTLAIRIFDSDLDNPIRKMPLVSSLLYTIKCYTFDDLDMDFLHAYYPHDTSCLKSVPFTDTIARKIIKDFKDNRQGKLEFLVHCTLGANRSPAVAIALNEIFQLGHNTNELKARYPVFNAYT